MGFARGGGERGQERSLCTRRQDMPPPAAAQASSLGRVFAEAQGAR